MSGYHPTGQARALGHHLACGLLVLAYVQGFPPWQALTALLGRSLAGLVPFAAAALALTVVALTLAGRLARGRRPSWPPLLAGAVLTVAILALPDAQFPAKRIHVAEYLVMAVLVRRALCEAVTGRALATLGALITALYGIHDEMLQGLAPDRSFGLRDILVDALSGLAGALMLHGLGLFGRKTGGHSGPPMPARWPAALMTPGLLLTGLGILLLLIALPAETDHVLPLWPALPLLAGGFVWSLEPPPGHAGLRQSLEHAVALALLLTVYGALSQVLGLPFR